MSIDLEEEIASLAELSKTELLTKWRERLKHAPPSHLNKPILVPLLAYKLQEQAFGGLKPEYKRRLRQLTESFDRDPSKPAKRAVPTTRIKAGTRLIRRWDGQTHQVTVAEKGFEYKGTRYKSLSEIARLITGTRWSGPLFFGLKQKATDRDQPCKSSRMNVRSRFGFHARLGCVVAQLL